MNTTPTNPPPAAPPTRGAETPRRVDIDPERRRQGDDFERLLRRKSGARDDERDSAGSTGSDKYEGSGFAGFALALGSPSARGTGAVAAGSVSASAEANGGATQAALQSALNTEPGQAGLAGVAGEAAGSWEVSVNQPLGVSLELRATRTASGAQGPAGWALSIGSPVLDATLLARHAPRLNERLKARAVPLSHVRIEDEDADKG